MIESKNAKIDSIKSTLESTFAKKMLRLCVAKAQHDDAPCEFLESRFYIFKKTKLFRYAEPLGEVSTPLVILSLYEVKGEVSKKDKSRFYQLGLKQIYNTKMQLKI